MLQNQAELIVLWPDSISTTDYNVQMYDDHMQESYTATPGQAAVALAYAEDKCII